jgi:chromosome segregation ATPase
MNRVKQPSASTEPSAEIIVARHRLAKAESKLKEAKERAREAKHRRKEARQAARHAKQRVKNAKADVAEANQALADAEQKLARPAKPSNMTRKSAKPRRTANTPALKPRLKKDKAPLNASSAAAATAIKATRGKSKPEAAPKAKVKGAVEFTTVSPVRQELPTASVPGSEAAAAAIPTEPVTTSPEEESEQKPSNDGGTHHQ